MAETLHHNVETPGLASIVVNNKDYADFLRAAIDSALAQTYSLVEVVVVDDGSSDQSQAIIESYGARVVPILNPESRGQPTALNLGVAASHGEFVFLLDSDDVYVPTKVHEIVTVLQAHSEVGACFHARDLLTDRGVEKGPDLGLTGVHDLRAAFRSGRAPLLRTTTSAMCFRRGALEAVVPMPEATSDLLGDHYLKWSMLATTPVLFDPRPLALQRLHAHNRFTRARGWKEDAEKQSLNALWLRRRIPGSKKFSIRLASEATALYARHGARPQSTSALRRFLRDAGTLEATRIVIQGGALCALRAVGAATRRTGRRRRRDPAGILL